MRSLVRLLVPGSIKEKHPEPEETVSQPSLAGTAKTWPSTSSSLKPESAALGSAVDKPAGRRKSFGLGLRSRRETLHTDTAHMPFSQEEEPPAQHIRVKPNPEPQQGMSPETVPPSLATPDRPSSDKNPLHSVSNLELLCRRDLDSLYDLSDLAGHHSSSPSHASPQAPMEHIDGKEEQRTPVIDFGGQSDSLQPSQQRRVSSAVSPPDDEGSRPGQPAQQPQHPSAGHATSNGSPTAVLEPLDRAAARRLAGTRPRSGSRVTASPRSGSHLGDLLAPRTPELTSVLRDDGRIKTVPYDTQAFWDPTSSLRKHSFGHGEGQESFHWKRPYKGKAQARAPLQGSSVPTVPEQAASAQAEDAQPAQQRPANGDVQGPSAVSEAAQGQADGSQKAAQLKQPSTVSLAESRLHAPGSGHLRGLSRDDLKHIFRSLRAEAAAYKGWLAEVQNENAIAELERGTLVDQVNELLTERNGLARQLHQAHIRLHAMEQEDRDREQSKVAALLHETSQLRSQLLIERDARSQAEDAQGHAEQQLHNLSMKHGSLRTSLHAAQKQARGQQRNARLLQEAVDRLKTENSCLQRQSALAEARFKHPVAPDAHLTAHVQELSSSLGRTMAAAQRALAENQDLSAQLQARQQELHAAQQRAARLSEAEAAAAEATAALQAARQEVGRLLVTSADVSSNSDSAAEVASLRSALQQACSANSSLQSSADDQVRTLRAEVSRQAQLLRSLEDGRSPCLSCKARDKEVQGLRRRLEVHLLYRDLEEQYYQKEQHRRRLAEAGIAAQADGRLQPTFCLGVEGQVPPDGSGGSNFQDIFTTSSSSSGHLGVGE